ncbi:MAG: M56 family metallopeptidase [Mucilaginibacter sp.]|uniref:M56 family metallopeptidase n=1 Tax=Mucilaginibacter sp. TaxID=1882438 RepID=UPI0034E3836E
METSLFILALSKTLPESCLQGIIVYLVLQLLLAVFKKSTSSFRFNLFYAASVLLFAGFVFNLFQHYNQVRASAVADNLMSSPSPKFAITNTVKLDWWQQLTFWTNHYAYTITGLYLIGLAFCVLRLTLGLININWFKRDKHLQQQAIWTEKTKLLATQFNLLKTVSVFLSNKIQVPLTIGFFKPIIVFPIALINQLSIQQTEAILLHELAHIKRADYLLNIVLNIIQSFLFFNPMIWLFSREINKYREQSCDDLVLNKTNDSIAYAQALLQIEQFRSSQLTLALAANGKKYTLLNRIKRITNMEINNPSPQNKLLILLLALTTIGLSVAWNMPAKKVLKHVIATHFKGIKEALDTTKSNSIIGTATITENAKAIQHKTKPVQEKSALQAKNNVNKNSDIVGTATVFNVKADTSIKTKNKFKIVLEDSVGNRKEYNSIEELPAEARKEFLKENGKLNQFQFPDFKFFSKFPDSNKLTFNNKLYSSPQWKKQAEAMRKQGEAMRKQGEAIRKQFNSPEWKKQQEEIRKQGEEIQKQFNSPEWKKQQEEIRKQGEEIRKQAEEIRKQFNSSEWKKQMEDLRKQDAN